MLLGRDNTDQARTVFQMHDDSIFVNNPFFKPYYVNTSDEFSTQESPDPEYETDVHRTYEYANIGDGAYVCNPHPSGWVSKNVIGTIKTGFCGYATKVIVDIGKEGIAVASTAVGC